LTRITRSNRSGSVSADTGVVEQHVDSLEAPHDPLGQVRGLRLVGDVDLLGDRLASRLRDLLRRVACGVEVDVGHDHAGAFARKQTRARLPDARACACDHAYLAVEPAHRLSYMLKLRCLSIKLGFLTRS